MPSNLYQLARRRWLLASTLAVVAGLVGAVDAGAAGLQTSNGSGDCAGSVSGGATDSTSWSCAVRVTTTVSPAGTSGGEATVTAATTIPSSCGTSSTATAYFTMQYTDALGSFGVSGYIPYHSLDGKTCTSNYAALTAPLTLSGQGGNYMVMTELCQFSISGPYEAAGTSVTAFGKTADLTFGVDNGANGTCTPLN